MKPFRMILMGSLIFLLLFSGIAYGAGWITKRLTATSGDSGSPKIAVNGSEVYVVWKDDTPGNDEIYFRKSTDGGVAWQAAQRLTTNAGDSESPAIAVDGSNVYVVWEDATPGISQIYFMKSEDGGNHWKAARALTNNKTAKAEKPAIAVVGANIYVAWHNDDSAKGGNCWIALTKSADRGAGWQAAKTLSGNTGSADATNPAVAAADSGVYVAWEENTTGNNEIYFRRSTNGGAVWQAPVKLTTNSGSSNSPAVAALGSTVYLAWSDATPGNREIYFRKSADQGAAWQPGLRLTNNSGRSEAPALAVNDSSLDVVWNDDIPGNFDIYHRQSTNGGASWREIERLTNNSGASCGQFLGVGGSQIFVVWQDPTPGNDEIYIMHKKPDMSPISVILPNASSVWVMGTTEKIKWKIPEGIAGQTHAASSTDVPAIDKVKIDLYKGSTLIKPVVAETSAGAGAYSWMVPAGLADGTDYMVRISSSTDGKVYEDSPPFEITGASLPDLIVYSLTHSPASPTTMNTITVTAVVKNVGAAQAGASTLSLKGGWESTPTTHAIPALAVGATATVTRTVGPLAAASYVVTAQADVNGAVAESNETNNVKTDSFVVILPPDLIIYSLTHSPANATMADYNTATAVVKNVGVSTAGASTMSLSAAGYTTMHSVPALAAGAMSTVTWSLGQLSAGTYTLTAKADVNNEVAESIETNNTATLYGWIVWPSPDLVASLSYDIWRPVPFGGSYFRVKRVVTNNGPGDAPSSWLDWSVVSPGGSGSGGSYMIGPLAAGESYVLYYNFRLLSQMEAGTWVFTLYSHGVSEWKYTNNNATMTYNR